MKYYLLSILSICTAVLGTIATAQADISIDRSNFSVNRIQSTINKSQPTVRLVMNPLELAIYQQINQYRQSIQLPPLTIDPIVSAQAKAHSEEMARTGKFGHNCFNLRAKLVAQKIAYRSVAENVATSRGYSRPDLVAVQGWIDSPGHYRNLVGRFDLTGIGVAQNAQGKYYFTQIFVRKR